MAVDDIFLLEVQYVIDQREMRCVFGYEQTAGSASDLVCQILGDTYDAAAKTAWLDMLATDVTLQCVVVRRLNSPAIPGVVTYGSSDVGTDPGLSLPSNSPVVFKFTQSETTARHNGRKYVSGISEDRLINGVLVAPFTTTEMQAWADAHKAQLTAGAPDDQVFDPVVVQRADPAAVPPIPLAAWAVDDVIVQTIMYRQRRRRTRRTGLVA